MRSNCYFICILVLIVTVLPKGLYGQDFVNNDLDYTGGVSVSATPNNWIKVDFTDPVSLASAFGMDVPDVCGVSGPVFTSGINGNPYSGLTFLSGAYSVPAAGLVTHEGIQQTVSGFNTSVVYTINFYQTVVKQNNLLDESGSWNVYIDNVLIGTTVPSNSTLPFNSNNLVWDFRTFNFTPTLNTHTFKFLPADDDANQATSSTDITAGLRMGIDSIYILPVLACNRTLDIGPDTVLCANDTLALEVNGFDLFTYLWNDGSTDSTYTIDTAGWHWIQIDSSLCSYTDSIYVDYVLDTLDLGNDTLICASDSLVLDVTTPGASYLWSDASTDSVLVVNQPDTVWVEVTIGACTYSDTIIVDFVPDSTQFLGPDTLFCVGTSVDILSQFIGDAYLWSDNSTDSAITVTTADTYWLDVTFGSCTYSDTIAVNYYPILNIDLGNDTTLCQGETLLLDATMANVTYLWSDNSTGATLTVSQADTIWVEVMQNGCVYTDTIIVDYFTPLTINLGNDTTLCQGADITLDATTAGATYLWPDNSTNPTLVVNQADTVWVEVFDGNCTYTDTIIVDYYPANDTFLGPDTLFCFGTSIDIETSLYGDAYLWSDGTTDSLTTVTLADTLWLEVSLNGCTYSDTIAVNYYPILNVDLGNDTTLCQGETLLLDATMANVTYLWSDNSTGATFTVSQADTIWVDVMQNGCVYTDTIIVDYFTPLTINLGNDTTLCQGADITLDATTAGAAYLWSDNSTNPTLVVNQADTVWVEVFDGNCTYTDTIIVDYYPANDTFLGPDTLFCFGTSIDIETSLYGDAYLWSDGTTDSLTTVTLADTLWLEVSLNGCTYSDTIAVNYYPILNVDLGNDTTLCQGETLLLDATMANVTYLWSDNSTGATLTVSQADTIWVDVMQNGCVYTDTIIVDYFTPLTINLGNDTTLCQGADITLDATTAGANYLWSDNSTNPTLVVNQADTVWVAVSDVNCTYIDTIIIDYYAPLTVDLGNDTSICDGDSVMLSVSFIDANYTWFDASIDNKLTIFNTAQVWLDVEQYGCLYSDTIEITVLNLPVVDLGNDTSFCEGGAVVLDAQNAGAIYEWQDLSNNQTFIAGVTGNYWVTVTDINGCVGTDTVYVQEIIVTANLGPDLLLCDGDIQVYDQTQAGASYEWQDYSTLGTYNVTGPGTYYVTVSIDQCTATDTVVIDYVYANAAFSVQANACVAEEIQFTNLSTVSINDAITSYEWFFGDNSSGVAVQPSHIYYNPGNTNVTLIAYTANGCADTTEVQSAVNVHANPIANFDFGPEVIDELDPEVHFTNLSKNEVAWTWFFDDFGTANEEHPVFTFPANDAGSFPVTLVVIDEHSCVDTIIKEVLIKENVIYYVPNAFTPDNNGFNSVFAPVFTDGFDPYSYHLTIYDKWGNIVFESYNHEIGWDGTFNNDIAQLGVYIWRIEFGENLEDEKHIVSGHVTLLR